MYLKNLENIVKKTIGYNEERGDQAEVINMPFSWSIMDEDPKILPESPLKEYILISYKPMVSLILAFGANLAIHITENFIHVLFPKD